MILKCIKNIVPKNGPDYFGTNTDTFLPLEIDRSYTGKILVSAEHDLRVMGHYGGCEKAFFCFTENLTWESMPLEFFEPLKWPCDL